MELAVQFKLGVPASIIDATRGLFSVIDGVQAIKLSLPPKTAPALLVSLHQRVVDAAYKHFATQRYGVHVGGVPASTEVSAGVTPKSSGQKGGLVALNAEITSAEAVLLGISFLEAVQTDRQLVLLLQQNGYLTPALAADTTPARRSNTSEQQQQQEEQQGREETEFLLPLLYKCGLLTDVSPLHDAAAVNELKQKTWRNLLAPAHAFRRYFGNHVGFYLSFLNAMTLWLLAPAIISTYLAWAVSSSNGSGAIPAAAAAVSSPLVPILLVFHLLWSAAGLKLWRRQEVGLNHKWYHDGGSSSSSSSYLGKQSVTKPWQQLQQQQQQQQMTGMTQTAYHRTTVATAAAPAGPSETAGACAASPTAAAAAGIGAIGRLPGEESPHAAAAAHWGSGLPAVSLVTPAAAGARREYTGTWVINPTTHQPELLNPMTNQLLRYLASIVATLLLLLAAAAVLLVCLNVQGYIPPHHDLVHLADLARLSLPGNIFAADRGLILSQVPLVLRITAVTLFTTLIFGPAAKLLTDLENHRTIEGFAASLTVKQATLNALFTFVPVAYVGLMGAGATAARAEVAAFFRIELIRRIAMELLMPWLTYWLSVRRVKRQSKLVKQQSKVQSNMVKDVAGAVGALVQEIKPEPEPATPDRPDGVATTAGSGSSSSSTLATAAAAAVSECLKPSYDIFTDCWELNRDLGYMLLFAAVYPPAAVICLLYNLVKIKQDCLKLLVVYKRPVPAQLRGIGSWRAVLTVQVFAAVITNIFLTGLSTGQLAQLLPPALVPESVKASLLAAAAARPSSSTAANQIAQGAMHLNGVQPAGGAGPMLSVLQDITSTQGTVGGLGFSALPRGLAVRGLSGHFDRVSNSAFEAAKMCFSNASVAPFNPGFTPAILPGVDVYSSAAAATAATPAASMPAVTGTAAADHLLLLFVLEHVLVMAMLLVMWVIPGEPAVVREASRQQQKLLAQLLEQQQQQEGVLEGVYASKSAKGQVVLYDDTSVGGVQGGEATKLHANPLYMEYAARPSEAHKGLDAE